MSAGTPSTRRPIRRLDPETVERIAAGEVVERPASAVKELVENAYDAGATTVRVELRGGGLERIEVADDGAGIPANELELAVERHATSKLEPLGPIEAIASLGFRGEALAAIGAVARLTLVSRPPDAEVARGITLRGGRIVRRFAEPRAPGTTVVVEELFFNTPARRKFLKSPVREQAEALRAVEQLYLSRPSVGLQLSSEGGELASLPPTRSLDEAAGRVLGTEFPRGSFAVEAAVGAARLDGRLGRPPLSSTGSAGLFLAVNDRAVTSRALAQAVRFGFADALPRHRFPTGVLHLTIDPSRVDVNVHPTKREVRLVAPRELEDAVRVAVRAALASAGPLSSPAAPPRSSPVGEGPEPRATAPRSLTARAEPLLSGAAVQRTLAVGSGATATRTIPPAAGRPRFELLGPVAALYWVASTDDGLVLIDQHAASERLLYDTLRAGGRLARQQLVSPISLTLTAGERATLLAHAEEVRAAGFEVEPFGPGTFRVLAVPSYRGRAAPARAVLELARELAEGGRATLPDGLEERRAASLACHAAIRAGDVVERDRIAELVAALDRLPDRPRSCPHGRPILVHLPRSRLDRWFLRSGG